MRLRGYFDGGWASDRDERKSTTSYAFLLSAVAISWCSKKQSCIALSTMESKYVACSVAAQESVWLKRFFQSLRVTSLADKAIKMYCDSMTSLAHAKDPKYHSKSKHIQTRYNYICLAITQGEVILQHISTSRMVANPLTKAIARDAFQAHVRSLGLCRI